MVKNTPYRPNSTAFGLRICSTLDQLRRFRLGPSHSTNQISVTSVCTNRYSTHSSALILKKIYSMPLLLLHRQERDHAQIRTNQRRRCQYRGYNCRTALDQLSKQHRKLPQGSLSLYIMYAGSAIVPSMSSHEAHPRLTATGKRIVGVAVGRFGQCFSPTKRRPKIMGENRQALHYQCNPNINLKKKRIFLHVTLL